MAMREEPEPREGAVDLSSVFLEGMEWIERGGVPRPAVDLTPAFVALMGFVAQEIGRKLAASIGSLPLPGGAGGSMMRRLPQDEEVW